MLVDSMGDVTITNDGATILKEIDVQHPAAKMLIEISKTTDNEVGDGTTSAVVFAGALLGEAEELINKGVHPTIIVDGYSQGSQQGTRVPGRNFCQGKAWRQRSLDSSCGDKHADQNSLLTTASSLHQ